MIDPISAVAAATTAFNGIKRMVNMGREAEDVFGQVGKWLGAVSDLREVQKQAENPPLLKSLLFKKSVEQEALELIVAQEKIKQQEKELRELIIWTYGAGAYTDMMRTREKIRKQREKAVYAVQRRKQLIFWTSISIIFFGGTLGLLSWILVQIING